MKGDTLNIRNFKAAHVRIGVYNLSLVQWDCAVAADAGQIAGPFYRTNKSKEGGRGW